MKQGVKVNNNSILNDKDKCGIIGITGVTGKLGAYTAEMVAVNGQRAVHLTRRPQKAKVYESAELRRMTYTNSVETVDALTGIDTLLMVSARENPNRVKEHKDFLDVAKSAGVKHIVYTSFYGTSD